MEQLKIKLYFDGACEPKNPGGHMGMGVVVFADGVEIHREGRYVAATPRNSNNTAEYLALAYGLRWLIQNGFNRECVEAVGDSQLVIRQMTGEYAVNGGRYTVAKEQADAFASDFPQLEFTWVPRDQNWRADEMSKQALAENGVVAKVWNKKEKAA